MKQPSQFIADRITPTNDWKMAKKVVSPVVVNWAIGLFKSFKFFTVDY